MKRVCRNCRHYGSRAVWMDTPEATCSRLASTERHVVTGERLLLCPFTERAGNSVSQCGPDARFFQPKPPSIWERLIARFRRRNAFIPSGSYPPLPEPLPPPPAPPPWRDPGTHVRDIGFRGEDCAPPPPPNAIVKKGIG